MSAAAFGTVPLLKTGYNKAEVDEFFEVAKAAYEGRSTAAVTAATIQSITFELVRGGYATHEVDAALDRLEAAFVAKQRADFVGAHGQQAWMTALADRARTLYPRLGRPDGAKFAPPARGQQGYKAAEVDALCARLVGYFDRQEPITSAQVRAAAFSVAKGNDAYAEGPVDAFFARAVEVLLGVE